ncbi:MAG: UDP-2,3-diacylglucosamine diphosphatase [Alphaproteobacteria bacterium]|nr:UDP-2,3-diacylglucosamine diphosphatase [Alphaproteobacteria bacterium]
MAKPTFPIVWKFDLHLGAKSTDAQAITNSLLAVNFKTLELTGDNFDGWKLRRRWWWPPHYNLLMATLIYLIKKGVCVRIHPGNHDPEIADQDSALYQILTRRYGVEIITNFRIHTTSKNKKFLVLHGDVFDSGFIQGELGLWIDSLEQLLMDRPAPLQTIVLQGERKPFSLAKHLATASTRLVQVMSAFDQTVYTMANTHRVDGIIHGHTHIPYIRNINGILHAVGGCWDHKRAPYEDIVEDEDGNIMMLNWPATPDPTLDLLSIEGWTPFNEPDPRYRVSEHEVFEMAAAVAQLWPAVDTPEDLLNYRLPYWQEPKPQPLSGQETVHYVA